MGKEEGILSVKKVKACIIAAANILEKNSQQVTKISNIKITRDRYGSLLYWSVRKLLV